MINPSVTALKAIEHLIRQARPGLQFLREIKPEQIAVTGRSNKHASIVSCTKKRGTLSASSGRSNAFRVIEG